MATEKTCEACGAEPAPGWGHTPTECLSNQVSTYRAEASRQHTALSHISGALVDSGVVVPADELGYGEAVRQITKQRDEETSRANAEQEDRKNAVIHIETLTAKLTELTTIREKRGGMGFGEDKVECPTCLNVAEGSVIRAVAPLRAKLAAATEERDAISRKLARFEEWPSRDEDDRSLPEDTEIRAAHPLRTNNYALQAEAMRLVRAKRSKSAIIALVNWLLAKLATATASEQAMAGRLAAAEAALYLVGSDAECFAAWAKRGVRYEATEDELRVILEDVAEVRKVLGIAEGARILRSRDDSEGTGRT